MSEKNHSIEVQSPEEQKYREALAQRQDVEAKRLTRFLSLPDLTRDNASPLFELIRRIKNIKHFSNFDDIKVPEIVRTDISFDLFNFSPDHPTRSPSDTYYIDKEHILRTHTTVMWYYYLNQPSIKERIAKQLSVGSLSYGKT